MKTPKKQTFFEWNNSVLIESIRKVDLNIILIIILDLLFYISSGFLVIFWLQRIRAKLAAFDLPDIESLGYDSAQQLLSEMKAFLYLIIFSAILLSVSIILLASIFKGIIWAKTTKTKISFPLISRFLGLNLVWMSFWFLILFLIIYLVRIELVRIFMIVALVAAIYFTNTLYTIFMKRQKLSCIFDAIKLNVANIHMFILPYTIIILLAFIIRKLGSLLQLEYSVFLVGAVLVIYAAFVRYYVSALLKKL